VVAELIGGEGVARRIVEAAIERAKHVVRSNRAMLAHNGRKLAERADARGVSPATRPRWPALPWLNRTEHYLVLRGATLCCE